MPPDTPYAYCNNTSCMKNIFEFEMVKIMPKENGGTTYLNQLKSYSNGVNQNKSHWNT